MKPPAVWRWYVGYCWLAALLHLVWVLYLLHVLQNAAQITLDLQAKEIYLPDFFLPLAAKMFGTSGVVFGIGSVAVLAKPKDKNGWAMHITNLAVGAATCILTPLALPILLGFLQPSVKQWFVKGPEVGPNG